MKIIITLCLIILLTACSNTVAINQQYTANNYSVILLPSFDGDDSDFVYERFLHAFATQSDFTFITQEIVQQSAENLGLAELLEKSPKLALKQIAESLNADAFMLGKVQIGRIQLAATKTSVSVNLQLIDTQSGDIVASSLEETDSLFFSRERMLEDVTLESVKYYQDIFAILPPNTQMQ
jgi:PBP1b-binding outer membrane lipoprotein LpoB